ncbi:hypothetical protein BAUCODRAFT_158619 [Baudoinia panamericana UAMH 10762]|uniref:SCP domain-containing protein n=1 Tax=Baudoinia panamericana (strain UAMH 10762) TaxID=717646 RepID=M2MRA3_BAUPA|nr:uncharacterized protein BAUCODRAFT_158619 [Baudoinia panamericana UAMH 10762]EMC93983.1 hypothetical protein BAUCODRAFT_158619 [Baudoinia panamericana UAMH 10762]
MRPFGYFGAPAGSYWQTPRPWSNNFVPYQHAHSLDLGQMSNTSAEAQLSDYYPSSCAPYPYVGYLRALQHPRGPASSQFGGHTSGMHPFGGRQGYGTQQASQVQQDRQQHRGFVGGSSAGDSKKACLRAHNDARAQKRLPALEWSDELAQHAAQWAQMLASRDSGMQHAGTRQEGENLAFATGCGMAFEQAIQAWLSEEAHYDGGAVSAASCSGGSGMATGHYTQRMWKSTTHVGMGKAQSASGSWYIVARYSPPGNFIGQKPY